ncbi:MAG TPA: VIT1/CCC1 transporter family protein [Candidatus Binatia bacterium]|jgi:VIT1/CCC1 family predicted Fe2+/Mn2+ transporter|nr:VIT1/CCC1 transporter family protein [Candidatus Binatia bacterium]
MATALGGKKAEIERRIRARELVFGIQDGLLSTVGLLSGVSAATQSRAVVTVTGIAAGVTGGISMAAGAYLAARTEQDIFEKELVDQERLASETPYLAQEALLETLAAEGLDRASAYRVVQTLARRRDLFLRTVQEKVLGLGTADLVQPVKGSLVMFLSFLIGAFVPVLPYLVLPAGALFASWGLSVATLLAVGVWKGAITRRPWLVSGLEFAGVALGASLVGWLVGRLLNVEVP